MIIIRLELLLDFDNKTKSITPAQAVFKALGGQVTGEKEPLQPGAVIRSEKDKWAASWHYDSCNIMHEDVDNYQECFKHMLATLEKINQTVPLGVLSRGRFRSYWILPAGKYDLVTLKQKYQYTFIKDSGLFSNSIDSCTLVEMQYNKWVLHHQSGAMDIPQLQRDFKLFKIREGTPKVFLFLATTVTSPLLVTYQSKDIEDFINKSFDLCKLHSDKFQTIMEGVL